MTPWQKWRADFASTRVQLTYGVAVVWCGLVIASILVTIRATQLMKTAQDAVPILQALAAVFGAVSTAFLGVVGAWFAGKWLQQNKTGGE